MGTLEGNEAKGGGGSQGGTSPLGKDRPWLRQRKFGANPATTDMTVDAKCLGLQKGRCCQGGELVTEAAHEEEKRARTASA